MKNAFDRSILTNATAVRNQSYEPPSWQLCLLVCTAEGDFLLTPLLYASNFYYVIRTTIIIIRFNPELG
jgi:hypothetical protein